MLSMIKLFCRIMIVTTVTRCTVLCSVDAINMPGLARKNTDRIRASKRKAE